MLTDCVAPLLEECNTKVPQSELKKPAGSSTQIEFGILATKARSEFQTKNRVVAHIDNVSSRVCQLKEVGRAAVRNGSTKLRSV